MDARRAEAMHGYYEACRELRVAEDVLLELPVAQFRACGGLDERITWSPGSPKAAYNLALDEEHAAVEDALAEGVTLVELDALAALAGSRFAPAWARERYNPADYRRDH